MLSLNQNKEEYHAGGWGRGLETFFYVCIMFLSFCCFELLDEFVRYLWCFSCFKILNEFVRSWLLWWIRRGYASLHDNKEQKYYVGHEEEARDFILCIMFLSFC